MNGVHDMGGMHGFGAVPDDDVQFHADWERQVYATNKLLRLQGIYNIHEYRHSVERVDPADYLASSYFERWLSGIEQLLDEKDVLSPEKIERRADAIRAGEYDPDATSLATRSSETSIDPANLPDRARKALRAGVESIDDAPDAAFEPGDEVVVRNAHPEGHTRVPRYARGARGTVTKVFGRFDLPDARAHGDQRTEPVYKVRFDAERLWGEQTDAQEIHLDMWESYLEPGDQG